MSAFINNKISQVVNVRASVSERWHCLKSREFGFSKQHWIKLRVSHRPLRGERIVWLRRNKNKSLLFCFFFYSSHCSLITDWQGSCTKRDKLNNHRNCVYCDELLTPWPHEAGWIVALHQCKPSSKPPAPEKARHNIPSFTGHKEDDSNLCLCFFLGSRQIIIVATASLQFRLIA